MTDTLTLFVLALVGVGAVLRLILAVGGTLMGSRSRLCGSSDDDASQRRLLKELAGYD